MSYAGYGAAGGAALGAAFGGPVGIPIGAALGGAIGSAFGGSNSGDGRGQRHRLNELAQLAPFYSIQWRASDARKAGLHPLATMGVPLSSSPVMSPTGTSPSGSVWLDGANLASQVAMQYARPSAAAQLRTQRNLGDLYAAEAELARARSRSVAMRAAEPERPTTDASFTLPGGSRVGVDPHVSVAEDYQKRYGDIVENVAGVGILTSDMLSGLYRHYRANRGSGRPAGIRRGRHPDTDTFLGGS